MTSYPDSIPESLLSAGTGVSDKSERKRRDNINERIQELLNVIPNEFFQGYYSKRKDSSVGSDRTGSSSGIGGSATGSDNDNNGNGVNACHGHRASSKSKATGTRDGKPNKGQILTQAVEYVTYLQNQIDIKNREEVELILKVKELSKLTGSIINDVNLENTSAEMALARIGLGPLAGLLEDFYFPGGNKDSSADQQDYKEGVYVPGPGKLNSQDKNNNFEYGGYSEYGDLDSLI